MAQKILTLRAGEVYTLPALFVQSDRLPDEVFDSAVQGFCERQCRGYRGTTQIQLVLLVKLYGTEFYSRLGGQLLLGQAGCLSCRLEAFLETWDLFHLSMTIWANLSSEAS